MQLKPLVCSFILLTFLAFFSGILFLDKVTLRIKVSVFLSYDEQRVHPPSDIFLPTRESVTLNDGVYTYHLNLSRLLDEFPHLQDYVCSHILKPKTPQKTSNPFIILAIKSHPGSTYRRVALRQTWARKWQLAGYEIRPIFLLGHTEISGQMEIVKTESREYGDVLQWDFYEGHHNLSLKERCFLEWIYHSHLNVEFIFKGDDDEYVNPLVLVNFIKTFASEPWVLHGNVMAHSSVVRHGKYKISEYIFPEKLYPNFLSGGGFIFSGPSARRLYRMSQKMPVFPLDDVYFGFLALAANLTFRHDNRFHVFGLRFEPCEYQRALVVHGITPGQLIEQWSQVENADC